MKTIAFSVYNLDAYSGASMQALKLASELSLHEIKIIFLNMTTDKTLPLITVIDGFDVVNISGRKISQLVRILKAFRKYSISLLHCQGFFTLPILVSFLLGKPIYLKTTLMGQDDFSHIIKHWSWYDRLLLNVVDVNNTLTSQILKINQSIKPNMQFVTIPNGVFINSKQATNTFRESQLEFLYVGAMVSRKRVLETIDFFIDHYSHINNTSLNLVGPCEDTPEIDIEYVQKIKNKIKAHNNIKLLGKKGGKELEYFYKSATVLFLFSEAEGMPNVVLEAMSYNCVPITTEMGGAIDDVIENNIDGFVIDIALKESPAVSKILQISENYTPYHKALKHFCIKKIAKENCMVYQKLS
jgi:glycosyltransferase involved in cell wall biosynthesis